MLGQEVDAKDLWDIVALSQSLGKDKMHMKRIGGTGREGILAAYAALFQPSIEEVIVINPPKSHMQGPYFLNALRVLDIPEALGLLAPRPLTIIGGKHPAFNRTEEIYRLAGAADKLTRK